MGTAGTKQGETWGDLPHVHRSVPVLMSPGELEGGQMTTSVNDHYYVWGSDGQERRALERCSTRKARAVKHFHKVKATYTGLNMIFLAKMLKDGSPDVVVAT